MAKFTFGSRYPGFILTLEPGGPKYHAATGQFIPKVPYRGVKFNEGVYVTENEEEAAEMRKSPSFKKDFWEITNPEEAKKVNTGRVLEVGGNVKTTGNLPHRR